MKTTTYRAFMQSFLLALLLATTAYVISGNSPSEQTKPADLRSFMAQKRAYSQTVLDGLMSEEYQTIIIAGENMRKMRADKRWERLAGEDYKRYSEDFEKSAQAMVEAARLKNLDDCMIAYTKCLQACYNCHKYVRSSPVPASFEFQR